MKILKVFACAPSRITFYYVNCTRTHLFEGIPNVHRFFTTTRMSFNILYENWRKRQ